MDSQMVILASIVDYQLEIIVAISIGLAYLSWKIFLQLRANYQHIDDDVLEDFSRGRLVKGSALYKRVVNHLTYCEECRDRLDQIRKDIRPDIDKILKRRF